MAQKKPEEIYSKKCDRAIIITVQLPRQDKEVCQEHLNELEELINTIDIEVGTNFIIPLKKINTKYLINKGRMEDIKQEIAIIDADLVVFDDALSPSQQRNLEKFWDTTVIDRQEVILDIFSQRAVTREAVLQVGLAKMKYSLPRLTRAWTHLSRQKGGTKGTRGEGETQLEVDKRIVLRKITKFQKELAIVQSQRDTRRKRRLKKPMPTAAIVGYTNAGKSSLLNILSSSDVLEEDKLFATLDPTTRKIELAKGETILITDTIGFIRKLPHDLVDAFKSTLEETTVADFIIHVLDISNNEVMNHFKTTMEVMHELKVDKKPSILLLNKSDLFEGNRNEKLHDFPEGIFISTKTKEGIDNFKNALKNILNSTMKMISFKIPHTKHDLIAAIHREGEIFSEKYNENDIEITCRVPEKLGNKIEKEKN